MKIVFAIYASHTHDARAIETIRALSMIGNVVVISIEGDGSKKYKCYSTARGRNYFEFERLFKQRFVLERPDVVFLHDNYCAPFIRFIKRKNPNTIILYDSSELYYDQKAISFRMLIASRLQKIEERDLRLVDGVFAANIERALIMRDRYGLENVPSVFDNIHRIDDDINIEECDKKYKELLGDKRVILYCGGIGEKRRTFDLIEAIQRMGNRYLLIIAGAASEQALEKYNRVFDNAKEKNFTYIGFITRSEIKYLLRKSIISVSLFDFSCANNIFCASGKIYESIFEGIPILTSLNPPLKRLCDEERIGVSTNDFYAGIKELEEKYDWYKSNVKRFRSSIDYDNRIIMFKGNIERFINQRSK